MNRDHGSSKSINKPVTVRIRQADYLLLREYADSRNASLNSVISEAIAQYGAKIEREQAIMRIQTLQRRLRSAHGLGTDSVELLRKMREGRARSEARDDPRTNEDRSGGGWR